MKRIMAVMLLAVMLTGCTGTTVVYVGGEEGTNVARTTLPTEAEGTLKTGLSVSVDRSGSQSASAEREGTADFQLEYVAVTVDAAGVIHDCVIDGAAATIHFDTKGMFTEDTAMDVASKNELGQDYGMKALGGAKYEWNEQVAALAQYVIGKTVEEVKNGAVDAKGYAADADLASTATIYLGGYIADIEAAVNNARDIGAQAGDELRLAGIHTLADSNSADGPQSGVAQLDSNICALTMDGDTITSCMIDGVQATVTFDGQGVITGDKMQPVQTKNELGTAYGLKAYAGSKYEWNEQTAAFSAYVSGKTAEEVENIAVDTRTAPLVADLASTVTIAIGDFQKLILKAAKMH